jgi:Putative zinc-finger
MTTCRIQQSATIELYFYDELSDAERQAVKQHLAECEECRRALEELTVIRTALESCPAVKAPPGGDWSAFMLRLDTAIRADAAPPSSSNRRQVLDFGSHRVTATLAMAALIVFVTFAVFLVMRNRSTPIGSEPALAPASAANRMPQPPEVVHAGLDTALAQISEQHLERSKLVVLGLATKDPGDLGGENWDYERTLASTLLSDTRLYRQTCEERGMTSLADVLRDLELVLLQTSMSETSDAESLAQLQRLIRRRDLITKMDVVATTGLVP